MKLTTLILLASLLQVSATTLAQKVTFKQRNVTIEKLLLEIRKQTAHDVFFEDDRLRTDCRIDVDFYQSSLEEVLNAIVKGTTLSYSVDEKTVVIKEKENRFFEKLVRRFKSIDVRGKVSSSSGTGLPGASIRVKNKNIQTTTDPNGNFLLKAVDEDDILVVSFVGYISRELPVKEEIGTVILVISESKLDEIQVIGYGTTTKRLNTGSVGSIKAETIEKQPVGNVLTALTARIPGLDIVQQSGIPGSSVTVRIRGTNSLTAAANDPFYLIDGVPFLSNAKNLAPNNFRQQPGGGASPFNSLNPADIESVEVLKDADATAIYGSRGANGVILITTKKGKTGKTMVDLNLASGFGRVARMMDVLDRRQYLDMRYEALRNDGVDLNTATLNVYDLKDWDTTRSTDWQKTLIGKTARYTNAQLSISGGDANTSFGMSGGYWRETTVFPGDFANTRGSARFNVNHKSSNNRFKAQLTGNFLKELSNLPAEDLSGVATTLAPVAPELYTPDGRLNWVGNTFNNPLAALYKLY